MNAVRHFEREAISLLGESTRYSKTLNLLADSAIVAEYEYTGAGYFLTIRAPDLPLIREVLTEPCVVGEWAGIVCGFIAFLENQSLTLECYTWTDAGIPKDFRDQAVVVRKAGATEIAYPSNHDS